MSAALAPYAIKAAVSTRGFLDQQRAHRLGVSVADVAQFRGPTGPTGARISGLQRSMAELAARKDNELQVTRFVEVSRARLTDLTPAVQASGLSGGLWLNALKMTVIPLVVALLVTGVA